MENQAIDHSKLVVIFAALLLVLSGTMIPFSSFSTNNVYHTSLYESVLSSPNSIPLSLPAASRSVAFAPDPTISGVEMSGLITEMTSGNTIFSPTQPAGIFIQTGTVLSDGPIMIPANEGPSLGIQVTGRISGLGTNQQTSFSQYATATAAIPGLWLDSSKRRTRSQIYIEILELMKRGPMTPFEIAFYARLNRKRTKDYTKFLKHNGFLQEEMEPETGKIVYVLSKEGFHFLERAKALFEHDITSSEFFFELAKKSDSGSLQT